MVVFKLNQDQVRDWFPKTYQSFIDELRCSQSTSNDVPEEKLEWGMNWGFFVKKAVTQEEKNIQMENYTQKMNLIYEDRIQLEMPRIRCSLSLKAGYYHRIDRVLDLEVPDFVKDMAKEIVKFMMIQEQHFVGNPEVFESIREFYESLVENMEMDNQLDNPHLNMDDILDKISEKGMSSLSPRELEYLEKMSKSK
jgi:hypothetical protein